MAQGTSVLRGALESEDTIVMVDAWRQLGVAIEWDRDAAVITVRGCGGQPNSPHLNPFFDGRAGCDKR
jgi:3-phosphoshikimate 1-carboxyvinyltransferase